MHFVCLVCLACSASLATNSVSLMNWSKVITSHMLLRSLFGPTSLHCFGFLGSACLSYLAVHTPLGVSPASWAGLSRNCCMVCLMQRVITFKLSLRCGIDLLICMSNTKSTTRLGLRCRMRRPTSTGWRFNMPGLKSAPTIRPPGSDLNVVATCLVFCLLASTARQVGLAVILANQVLNSLVMIFASTRLNCSVTSNLARSTILLGRRIVLDHLINLSSNLASFLALFARIRFSFCFCKPVKPFIMTWIVGLVAPLAPVLSAPAPSWVGCAVGCAVGWLV